VKPIQFKDNSTRLSNELDELRKQNNDLYEMIVNDICPYISHHFGEDTVVTMILRTDVEQDAIYKGKTHRDGRKYDEKPWKSPHQFWHGVDLRSRDLALNEIKQLTDYINQKYNKLNHYKTTADCHDVGVGEHLHVQFWRK